MTKLLFTADGRLREHAPGAAPRVLAHVVDGPDGRLTLLAAEHRYEIVPLSQSGWGLELRDARGEPSGGFRPFRLRSGGHLRVGEVGMSLHGRPWSHEGWAFSLPDRRLVDATITDTSEVLSDRAGAAAAAGAAVPDQAAPFMVVLEAATSLELHALAEVLALGSWLIARWHLTPAADHVLASAGAGGTGPASGSAAPAPAGIRAQTAN
jgi:hypothetical protein